MTDKYRATFSIFDHRKPATFSVQLGNNPSFITLLDIRDRQFSGFGPVL